MRFLAVLPAIVLASTLVSACSGASSESESAPVIAGVWQSSDGTGVKRISDQGPCSGMYYADGKPLDIGGGMTCTLSSKKDADGYFSLLVEQPPNSETLKLKFTGDDTVEVYGSGAKITTLTRQ